MEKIVMDVKIIQINEDVIIGGFSVETTLKDSNKDIELLYNDFMYNGKMEMLNNITNDKHEYYGVIWYTKLHEAYKYLLGQKIVEDADKFDTKIITKGEYAVVKFPSKYDGIKAWTEFYNEGFIGIGYKPKEEDDLAFEYYPNGFDGEYELWSLIEKV
jgi:DNA gyrase inhibitor GyrI